MTTRDLSAKLQSHQQWLGNQNGGGKRADLRGADLRNVNFEGADLRFADFRAADCRGVNFTKADCRHADFRGANLCGAVCIGTQFQNARLDGADLSGIDLRSASWNSRRSPVQTRTGSIRQSVGKARNRKNRPSRANGKWTWAELTPPRNKP